MADSSLIDNGIVSLLGSDGTLLGLCPNGVYWDEAPPNSQRFVIVSLVDEHDIGTFRARAFEEGLYLVKAVMLSTAGGDIKAAAARIDTLLEQQTLTISGYAPVIVSRESRVRMTEVDDVDQSIRWFHRGGRYTVAASL
jgi:hypothetical protein